MNTKVPDAYSGHPIYSLLYNIWNYPNRRLAPLPVHRCHLVFSFTKGSCCGPDHVGIGHVFYSFSGQTERADFKQPVSNWHLFSEVNWLP